MVKMVLPEKLSCIAVDAQARWLVGGTAAGRVYLWEVRWIYASVMLSGSRASAQLASGILWNAWDAHYRRVAVLRFTPDGFGLLAGSDDAGVSVWSVSEYIPSTPPSSPADTAFRSLLDVDKQDSPPSPWAALSDHTLPVSDIAIGHGTFPRVRAFSASADHTLKAWDLSTRALLTTVHLPAPLTHVVLDGAERALFGAAGSAVYEVRLFAPRADGGALEALGGHGRGDMLRIDAAAANKRLFSAGAPVSALALSLTGATLVAGTATGKVLQFDVASHQLLRTFALGAPVTHVSTLVRAPESALSPPVHVAPLQRTRDAKARAAHEAWVRLPPASADVDALHYGDAELCADLASLHPGEAGAGGAERVQTLEEEVARLRAELGQAKGLNDRMWDAVVSTVMKDGGGEGAPAAKKKRK
jgi:pre-rRNA-processing protein IPI3